MWSLPPIDTLPPFPGTHRTWLIQLTRNPNKVPSLTCKPGFVQSWVLYLPDDARRHGLAWPRGPARLGPACHMGSQLAPEVYPSFRCSWNRRLLASRGPLPPGSGHAHLVILPLKTSEASNIEAKNLWMPKSTKKTQFKILAQGQKRVSHPDRTTGQGGCPPSAGVGSATPALYWTLANPARVRVLAFFFGFFGCKAHIFLTPKSLGPQGGWGSPPLGQVGGPLLPVLKNPVCSTPPEGQRCPLSTEFSHVVSKI